MSKDAREVGPWSEAKPDASSGSSEMVISALAAWNAWEKVRIAMPSQKLRGGGGRILNHAGGMMQPASAKGEEGEEIILRASGRFPVQGLMC